MQINKLNLINFKFHEDIDLTFTKKNSLIFGENGTGKSSIYWGIYSILKKYFRNNDFNFEKFKNKYNDELKISINIGDHELSLPSQDYSLPDDIDINNFKTIYFISQELLHEIINNDDFFQAINDTLRKYFLELDKYLNIYTEINLELNTDNHIEMSTKKLKNDASFVNYLKQIELRANDILVNELEENFLISFDFESGLLTQNTSTLEFNFPKITLKIENENNLKFNFNEAKLKLTSFSIFFSLIKLEEKKDNTFKLLVFDDFLTSLDMSNRNYIINYILKNFKKYQKIIFTHNLQFFNLIKNSLAYRGDINKWEFKSLYTRVNANEKVESIIYDINDCYISQAKEKLNINELQNCGNLIRKEFERIIHELENMYEIGKKEETSKIVELILNDKPIYVNQNIILDNLVKKIKQCKDLSNNMNGNKDKIKIILDDISITPETSNPYLKSILKNLLFYKKIIMNKSSHDNPDDEMYRKEYSKSIEVIEELNALLTELNKK